MPVSLRQASPRSCVITEETFAEVSIQVYSHRFVMEGPAALSNIYCPSQLFLTHVLKILTLSQSFKRNEKIGQRLFTADFKAYNSSDKYIYIGAFPCMLLFQILIKILPRKVMVM